MKCLLRYTVQSAVYDPGNEEHRILSPGMFGSGSPFSACFDALATASASLSSSVTFSTCPGYLWGSVTNISTGEESSFIF